MLGSPGIDCESGTRRLCTPGAALPDRTPRLRTRSRALGLARGARKDLIEMGSPAIEGVSHPAYGERLDVVLVRLGAGQPVVQDGRDDVVGNVESARHIGADRL